MARPARAIKQGGNSRILTLTASGSAPLAIGDQSEIVFVTAASPVTVNGGGSNPIIAFGRIEPGRKVTIVGAAGTSNVTFTGTAKPTTTSGLLMLGAATRVVGQFDSLAIRQMPNGQWIETEFVTIS